MNDAANANIFYLVAAILSLTGLYFFVTGNTPGGLVMEFMAGAFAMLGYFLKRRLRASK